MTAAARSARRATPSAAGPLRVQFLDPAAAAACPRSFSSTPPNVSAPSRTEHPPGHRRVPGGGRAAAQPGSDRVDERPRELDTLLRSRPGRQARRRPACRSRPPPQAASAARVAMSSTSRAVRARGPEALPPEQQAAATRSAGRASVEADPSQPARPARRRPGTRAPARPAPADEHVGRADAPRQPRPRRAGNLGLVRVDAVRATPHDREVAQPTSSNCSTAAAEGLQAVHVLVRVSHGRCSASRTSSLRTAPPRSASSRTADGERRARGERHLDHGAEGGRDAARPAAAIGYAPRRHPARRSPVAGRRPSPTRSSTARAVEPHADLHGRR